MARPGMNKVGMAPPTPVSSKMVLQVYCKGGADTIGMDTLIGEYVEVGSNHQRKTFKRTEASEDGDVYLYYWDARDGVDQSGWWFGDSVGGTQVWSRCVSAGALPPAIGWKVPWDGPVVNALCVEQKKAKPAITKAPMLAKAPAKATPVQRPMAKPVAQEEDDVAVDAKDGDAEDSAEERLQKATDRVSFVEVEAVQALDSVKSMLESDQSHEGTKVVEELLQSQQAALTEAQKAITSDTIQIRKLNPKVAGDLSKLGNKLRGVLMRVSQELVNVKKLSAQKQKEANDQQQRDKHEEMQLEAEQRDAKLLEEALPACMDLITQAEDSVDAVVAAAVPLEGGLDEEMVDEANEAIKETEEAVTKAQAAVQAARKELSAKTVAAQRFAPEAQKVAIAEYSALMEKANEAQLKITKYRTVRKDWAQKHEAKRIMAEVTSKLGTAEVEVEKFLNSVPEGTKTSDEGIKAADAMMPAVLSSLLGAMKFVDQKVASSAGALKQDLLQMQERGRESKQKVEAFKLRLRTEADQIQLESLIASCSEKTQQAEDVLEELTVAETPFLKGVEGIPESEAQDAIKACEDAAKKADIAANAAKSVIRTKSAEVKRFAESSRKTAVEQMGKLQARVDVALQKIAEFKKEMMVRKTGIILQELTSKVTDAETKLKDVAEAAKPLHAEGLEEQSVDALRDATERTLEAEKVAAVACVDARKVFAAKQKEGPGKDANYSQELQKVNARLGVVTQELAKERKVALVGEKLYKSKQIVLEKAKEIDEVEAEVEKVEIMTTPVGDERPSAEAIEEMDTAVKNVQKTLTALKNDCGSALQAAQGVQKEALQKILARAAEAQGKVDEIVADNREQSERMLCERIVNEAKSKLEKVEEAFQKTEEAEAPYLKGLDVLPLDEALQAVADSESSALSVQQGIAEARTFLSAKSLEVRRFVEVISKPGMVQIAELISKNDEALKRLSEFKKETEGRKKKTQLQDGEAKVAAVEEAVKKTTEAAAPLATENAVEVTNDVAQELCEKLGVIEKAAQEKMDEARKFLMDRQKEQKTSEDRAEFSKLLARLNSVQVDLAKARSAANEAEQKFVSRLIMAEVDENVQRLESQVEEASKAAAPLLEEGGRDFIVASMAKMLIDALSEHLGRNGTPKEDAYKQMTNGAPDTKATEAEFVAYFAKVPEMCGRPDLAFSNEQLAAIFENIDEDCDGALTQADFLNIFRERFVCVSGISVTDVFDLQGDECRTLSKAEAGDVLEAKGEAKTHDSLGISRMEVKVLKDGTSGWVTLQGNQGTAYLEPFTAYAAFMQGMEKKIAEAQGFSKTTMAFINEKSVELKEVKQGPLHETKDKLMKLRPKVSVLQAKLEQLKKRIDEGRREHAKREEFERRKAAEKKDRKAAAVILKTITEKLEKAQAALSALAVAASPLVADETPNLGAVPAPLTVQKTSQSKLEAVEAAVVSCKESLSVHEPKVATATKGPWFEAKQELAKISQQISDIEERAVDITASVKDACDQIGKLKLDQVSVALRDVCRTRAVTIDTMFLELAGEGKEHIAEDKFMAHVDGVAKLEFTPEHKQVLWVHVGASSIGISRRTFFKMLERYCRCLKDIAITSEFDIGAGDIVRKLEVDEFVEILEGPRSEEAGEIQVPRVRAKALSDGATGWITVKGNQGTAYLEETGKPCYFATESVAMQDGFASEGCKELRPLRPLEVIEVLEGPRKEAVGVALRAKGKASSDGATGWFTLKTKQGVTLAEPGQSCYTTLSAIALTDNLDIKACKVLRKLAKGEALMVLEGPLGDEKAGVTRIKVIAKKDNKEGWVTVKGNAGSVYAEETGRFYSVSRSAPLQKAVSSDSDVIRTLEEKEALEILEGPMEETSEAPVRLRARCVSDGTTGWLTVKGSNLERWAPRYRCVNGTVINDAFEVSKAEALRRLETGETLDVVDGPRHEAECDVIRVKARAASDGVIGWVTVAGNQGTAFLENIA